MADQPAQATDQPPVLAPLQPLSYTLEQVSKMTGFSLDALTKGCRRAKRGLLDGIPHSELAGTRVMTQAQIEELLARTAVAPPEDAAGARKADELTRRREDTIRHAQRRIGRARKGVPA